VPGGRAAVEARRSPSPGWGAARALRFRSPCVGARGRRLREIGSAAVRVGCRGLQPSEWAAGACSRPIRLLFGDCTARRGYPQGVASRGGAFSSAFIAMPWVGVGRGLPHRALLGRLECVAVVDSVTVRLQADWMESVD
jgi:hypothetical protein